ncbi:MAG TPA: tetratricopeptide repeat protein [Holophagaceae bacterium]|nr:tetratricopeptide repeat protein [Holophagaceae bacterium]
MRLIRTFAVPATAALLTLGCASDETLKKVEQEVGDLKVEVFRLRQQAEEAAKKAESEQKAAAEARAQDRRFQADLQQDMRQVQDTVRVMNNRLGSVGRANAGSAAVPAAPTPAAPVSEDEKAFQAATLDYNKGSYGLAAEGFQLFLKNAPNSPRRPEALYFLGLSHYNQRAYDKGQAAFEQVLREHPGSAQFLPAKLKRAQCLLKQGLKPAATKAFKELVDGFQGTPEARTAQQELADLGL